MGTQTGSAQADFLTAQKNHVVATNSLNQTWLNYQRKSFGDNTSSCFTDPAVVALGAGQIVVVSVVASGSNSGKIFDSASLDELFASNALMAVPTEPGVYQAPFRVKRGIVVSPGEGQQVVVTYSMD